MFKSKTVFIVGAGASCEANLPSGEELKGRIAKILDIKFEPFNRQSSGDARVVAALQEHVGGQLHEINPYLPKAHQIRDVIPKGALSIDNYLDAHAGDEQLELCGKLAIVKGILDAEAASKLKSKDRYEDGFDFDALADTWYLSLLKLLTENVRRADVAEIFQNISIITFNYDRCIERYLVQGLAHYYAMPTDEAAAIVKTLSIQHPYGQVGALDWQEGPGVRFGDYERADLLAISKQIKTFAEGLDDNKMIDTMRGLVAEAETLVFLGFAFHPQNLELIKPEHSAVKRVFGTVYEVSGSDQGAIKLDLAEFLGRKVLGHHSSSVTAEGLSFELLNATCVGLFKEYWRSLSAAAI